MGIDSTPPGVQNVLDNKSQGNIAPGTYYKIFLMQNKKEIMHNIDESIKSINEKLVYEAQIAYEGCCQLEETAPPDDDDPEVTNYRQSVITNLRMDLAVAAKALLHRRKKLEILRRDIYKAILEVKKEVKEHINQ